MIIFYYTSALSSNTDEEQLSADFHKLQSARLGRKRCAVECAPLHTRLDLYMHVLIANRLSLLGILSKQDNPEILFLKVKTCSPMLFIHKTFTLLQWILNNMKACSLKILFYLLSFFVCLFGFNKRYFFLFVYFV